MRRFAGFLLLILLAVLGWLLDNSVSSIGLPPLGRLLDPMNGCWAAAEPINKNFSQTIPVSKVDTNCRIWFDKRLIPHIKAGNNHDLYFLQGYVHASFRLWQMDMETRAAAGRISEVAGKKALVYDRMQRRKGMVFAAERSLLTMEQDARTKVMLDAYTEGINAYIQSLQYKTYPLEYKLMAFSPEPWTNIKTALLLKYMADDLTGAANDIPVTYLKEVLPKELFDLLYPAKINGSATVIPSGTPFEKPSLSIPPTPTLATVFPVFTKKDFTDTREEGIGSNNWVVGSSRTASGSAMLCNDPHLGLHLPSLWYEMQLIAPGINVYGASLPGAPGVIIGFNDSVCWGLTNNYRDVKDYYLIKKMPGNEDRYLYDTTSLAFEKRVEHIIVKNAPEFIDTVLYTVHGPVQYDVNYPAPGGLKQPLAMAWMGHRGTNELLSVYLLNRATNYQTFVTAISHFECPAQNFAYADCQGNIAMWGQGQFINKWKGQGTSIMDGSVSASKWGENIPVAENPHAYNPAKGYLFSANECVTDSTYPYWYDGDFREFRGWRINNVLDTMKRATVPLMFALQQDTYSLLAAGALPVMLKHLDDPTRQIEINFVDSLQKWHYDLTANSISASLFQIWWYELYSTTWSQLGNVPEHLYPTAETTLKLLLAAHRGPSPIKEWRNLDSVITVSWKKTMDSVTRAAPTGLEWYKVRHTKIEHLSKLAAFSYSDIKTGGWGNTVNAVKAEHGPSWRMVVQMGKSVEGYCIYPGGQSGNPGSKYYNDFIADWANGKYNPIRFYSSINTGRNPSIVYTWKLTHE